jgi:hypothetical protein
MVEDKAQERRRPFGAGGWGARHDVPAKADFRSGRSLRVRSTYGRGQRVWGDPLGRLRRAPDFFYSKRP